MAVDLQISDDGALRMLADRDAVHDRRGRVAELVEGLAGDVRFHARRPELLALSKALLDGGNRESVWRGVDLVPAFTPENTIRLTPRKRRRVAGFVGALAAAVVFLPVWWTWTAFHAATEAYQRVLAAGSAAGESFLQLWATGFLGELSPQHWLPNVALWSTTLILLCILLIVGERLTTRSADRADDDEYQECSARLASVLNLAQITIASRSVQDPIQGLDVVQEAVEQLLAAHQQTREATGALRDASQELEQSTGRVAEGLDASVTTVVASFQRGVDGLVSSLEVAMEDTSAALLGSVGGVAKILERSVVSASGTLESSVSTAVGSLNTTVGQVGEASSGMRQAVTASASAQQELVEATRGLAANTQTLEAILREHLRSATDAIIGEILQLTAEAGNLAKSTEHVGASLGHHTSALQHQITELTQIRASLERVSGLGAVGDGVTASAVGR